MRRGFFLIFCMFVLNCATIFVNGLPLFDGTQILNPYDPDQVNDALNATELVDRWDPPESGGLFGDVKAGLQNIARLNQFINSFPSMLADLGLPSSLQFVLMMIWNFIWWLSIVDLIMGGKIFGV